MSLFRTGRALEDELSDAPNPKPTAQDKERFGRIASLYTAFSIQFAEHAIDMCMRAGCTRILDPFSGMGTLAEAARTRPLDLQLGDLSPFAALAGAFRAARTETIRDSISMLDTITSGIQAETEREFFAQLFEHFSSSHLAISLVLAAPSAPEHQTLALSIFLAVVSRIRLYARFTGSNPTWIRRPDAIATGSAAREAIIATLYIARDFAKHLPDIHPANKTTSTWTGIDSQVIPEGSLDAIITSPPYANRTDYIRHYQPASELLLAATNCTERRIRVEQIGTPLIRSSDPARPFPDSVNLVLERVQNHHSYASKRYYHKSFLYYFADMFDALSRMQKWLKNGGTLILVVQDTYYKELYIPTGDLLSAMAEQAGLKAVGRHAWLVRNHLSSLSPHPRKNAPVRPLREYVLAFSK